MKVTIEKITLGIACGVEKIWWNLKYSKFIKLEYVFFLFKTVVFEFNCLFKFSESEI